MKKLTDFLLAALRLFPNDTRKTELEVERHSYILQYFVALRTTHLKHPFRIFPFLSCLFKVVERYLCRLSACEFHKKPGLEKQAQVAALRVKFTSEPPLHWRTVNTRVTSCGYKPYLSEFTIDHPARPGLAQRWRTSSEYFSIG